MESVTPGSPRGGQGPLGPADVRPAARLPPVTGSTWNPTKYNRGDIVNILAKGSKFP